MNSSTLDLATLPAAPQQRRVALIAIAVLAVVALAGAPFARLTLGAMPNFVMLYGGAVLMSLAISATILFGQFALSRKPSLLVLACGALFSGLVSIPYIVTMPGIVGPQTYAGTPSAYLWIIWHTALALAFFAYAALAARDGSQRVGGTRTTAAVVATVIAAYAAASLVVEFAPALPPVAVQGTYLTGIYLALLTVALLSVYALVLLFRRKASTVIDIWLTVPVAALLIESLLNALGGTRYSVGWYVSRLDILVATTFLVVALLSETNRLSRVIVTNERRLRGIVNGVADALLAVDERGIIVSVNRAAAALFGFAGDDLVGMPVARVLPDYPGVAELDDAGVLETIGSDARGTPFPVEFARGREASSSPGNGRIIIVRDITQRKAAEEAIRAAHDRAVEAADVKSQFLATMSHEIRTPINAVVGMSELLLRTPLSDEARDYALTVRDSADSLLAIVNDILDFSKIEAGRMELESIPFAPVAVLENATDILSAAARKKGLSLSTYVAPDVPRRVVGDGDRLRQIFLNLIGNAVKFTERGSVTVRAVVERVDAEKAVVLRFSVSDTGPGITPEAARHLFQPFRQADQSTRRRYGGTGLGLSISRRLVELMGGTIGFDSAGSSGATFWFTVPFAQVPREDDTAFTGVLRGLRLLVIDPEGEARQAVDQYLFAWGAVASSTANAAHGLDLAKAAVARGVPFDAVIVDRAAGEDAFALGARLHAIAGFESVPLVLVSAATESVSQDQARAHGFSGAVRKPIRRGTLHDALVAAMDGAPAPGVPVASFGPAVTEHTGDVRVLVAEDNPVNRKLALQQLKKLGYAAHSVADGREAIEAVARGNYDLVLMDCQMPEVDGFEATRAIRAHELVSGRHVPIVAMTANALEGDREACLGAGMDDYLAKPVQLDALGALVERFVGGVRIAG